MPQALEEHIPDPPLLPTEQGRRQEILAVCDRCELFAQTGYGYMTGGRAGSTSTEEPESSRREKFEQQLGALEQLFSEHGGPFLLG